MPSCPRSTFPEGPFQLVWCGSRSQPLARGGHPNHGQWHRGSPGENWHAVIRARGNRSWASENTSAHPLHRLGQIHHKVMSRVPGHHGMEGVSTRLMLFPHLFLTSTLRERKPGEDSGSVLGLTTPWAGIQSGVPQQERFLVLCGAHRGSSGGEGSAMVFSSPKLPRVLNAPSTHNRVFSPDLLNISLKSECLSRIINLCRNAGREGTATQQRFWRELPGERKVKCARLRHPLGPWQSTLFLQWDAWFQLLCGWVPTAGPSVSPRDEEM